MADPAEEVPIPANNDEDLNLPEISAPVNQEMENPQRRIDDNSFSLRQPIDQLLEAINAGKTDKVKEILENFIVITHNDPHFEFDESFTIKINESVTYKTFSTTPANLAWSRKHFDILQLLLEFNSKFPANFHTKFEHYGVKNFVRFMEKFHDCVKAENLKKIAEYVSQNPRLKHFFNSQNDSAISTAIKLKKFKTFDFLISQGLKVDLSENVFEKLFRKQKKAIKFTAMNFQGEKIVLNRLLQNNLEIFNKLSAEQIVEILRKKSLDVGESFKLDYRTVPRKLVSKSGHEIHSASCILSSRKVYVVADFPGSGRTTTMKMLMKSMKNYSLEKWVQYVDVKEKWRKEFETFDDVKEIFYKNNFEKAIFMQIYGNNSVDIIWDNIDELKGVQKENFFAIVKNIKEHTENRQWFITQPKFLKNFSTLSTELHFYQHGFEGNECELLLMSRMFDLRFTTEFNEACSENCSSVDNQNSLKSSVEITPDIFLIDVDKLHQEDKIFNFISKLEQIQLFNSPLSLQNLKFIADFAFTTNFETNFSTLVVFLEQYFDWFCRNLSESKKTTLTKALQTHSLKKLVNNEKFHIFITEAESQINKLAASTVEIDYETLPSCEILLDSTKEKFSMVDEIFEDFFIAQYTFNNAFYIEDEPSEDEKALRVNLLLIIANMPFVKSNCGKTLMQLLNEKIKRDVWVEKGPKRRKFYDFDLRELPEFKCALGDLTFYDSSDNCNFIANYCQFFKFDKENLNFLWKVEENENFLLWWIREKSVWTEPTILKVARIFFKKDEIKKLEAGKNQLGSLLYKIWSKRVDAGVLRNEVEKEEDFVEVIGEFVGFKEEDEENSTNSPNSPLMEVKENPMKLTVKSVKSKKSPRSSPQNVHPRNSPHFTKLRNTILENNFTFFEFLATVEPSLSQQELSEVILRNSNDIFLNYIQNIDEFTSLWSKIEKIMTKNEIIEILRPHRIKFNIILTKAFQSRNSKLLEAYFEKFEKYLDEKIIIDQLKRPNRAFQTTLMLAIDAKSKKIFDIYWKFLLKFMSVEMLKKFLLQSDANGCCAIHYAAISGNEAIFDQILAFYHKNFNREELSTIFTSENIFLAKMIANSSLKMCKAIVELAKFLFSDNNEKMKEFLLQEGYRYSGQIIFECFMNQEVYRDKLRPFVRLLRGVFDHENAEEVEKFNKFVTWNENFVSNFDVAE